MVDQSHQVHIDERHLHDLERVLRRRIGRRQYGDVVARGEGAQYICHKRYYTVPYTLRLRSLAAPRAGSIQTVRNQAGMFNLNLAISARRCEETDHRSRMCFAVSSATRYLLPDGVLL
jgi:hypothetical protein